VTANPPDGVAEADAVGNDDVRSAADPVPGRGPDPPRSAVPRQANETDREVVGGGRLVQLAERVDTHLETFPEASKKHSYASITFVFGRRKPSIENGAGLPFSDVARTLSSRR
jgi:hypothetical protein